MEKSCPFCDLSKFIGVPIYESENFHLMAGLGQITGGYVYLFPKAHIPCIGAIEEGAVDELTILAESLCAVISCEYKAPVTVFEHGVVGQTIKHAHLHFMPTHIRIGDAIDEDFHSSEKDSIGSFANLVKSYGENSHRGNLEPYLFWIEPDKGLCVCWNPPAPLMYLRTVAAKQLGHPERADWRTIDPELDRKLWQETAKRLRPYFA